MTVVSTTQVIDPPRLLTVRVAEGLAERRWTAIWCRYVIVQNVSGLLVVAIEIGIDPVNQQPETAYLCTSEQIRRILLPPAAVRGISPYQS